MIAAIERGYAPGAADKAKARFTQGVPLKRYGTPKEVAELVLCLASDEQLLHRQLVSDRRRNVGELSDSPAAVPPP